jgi:hypothetical protein
LKSEYMARPVSALGPVFAIGFVYSPACVADLFTTPIAVGLYSDVLSDAEIANREFELGLRS